MTQEAKAPAPAAPAPEADDAVINISERIRWYQSPIDREVMMALMKRSDWQGFRQVGLHLALIALTSSLVYYSWLHLAWPWTLLALFLHGSFYGFFGGGIAGHELSHRTVFKTRWLNDFFAQLSSIMGWGNHVWFRASHVKHHQYTVHHDLDMEVTLPSTLTWKSFLWIITGNPVGVYNTIKATVRRSLGRVEGVWENRVLPESATKLRREVANCSRIVLAVHVVAAILFIVTRQWIGFALFTFAPFYAGWLQMLVGFPQHAGMQPDVPDFRRCCRTYTANPFVTFLYWQMNYHVEHHMYAAVPFYNLKKLRAALAADLPPASHGLWATWREILDTLKRQKADPSYYYAPPIPTPAAAAASPAAPAAKANARPAAQPA